MDVIAFGLMDAKFCMNHKLELIIKLFIDYSFSWKRYIEFYDNKNVFIFLEALKYEQ